MGFQGFGATVLLPAYLPGPYLLRVNIDLGEGVAVGPTPWPPGDLCLVSPRLVCNLHAGEAWEG